VWSHGIERPAAISWCPRLQEIAGIFSTGHGIRRSTRFIHGRFSPDAVNLTVTGRFVHRDVRSGSLRRTSPTEYSTWSPPNLMTRPSFGCRAIMRRRAAEVSVGANSPACLPDEHQRKMMMMTASKYKVGRNPGEGGGTFGRIEAWPKSAEKQECGSCSQRRTKRSFMSGRSVAATQDHWRAV